MAYSFVEMLKIGEWSVSCADFFDFFLAGSVGVLDIFQKTAS